MLNKFGVAITFMFVSMKLIQKDAPVYDREIYHRQILFCLFKALIIEFKFGLLSLFFKSCNEEKETMVLVNCFLLFYNFSRNNTPRNQNIIR